MKKIITPEQLDSVFHDGLEKVVLIVSLNKIIV